MRRTISRFQSGRARVFGILSLIVITLFAGFAYAKLRAVEAPEAPDRTGHTATLLADGRVLVVGGEVGGETIARADLFDSASGSSSPSGGATFARSGHSATLLSDGRVLVAGGRNGAAALDSAEAWSPETGSFAMVSRMNVPRGGHVAVTLADGRVLIAGGDAEGTMELFDGSSFERIGIALRGPRSGASAIQLADGRILIAGGRDGEGMPLASADLIDLREGLVTRASMKTARVEPLLTMLPDGKVQVIGGDADATMEIFADHHFTALTVLRVLEPKTIASTRLRFAFERGEAAKIAAALSPAPAMRDTKRAVSINGAGGTSTTSSAWVTTDKADYHPGERVTVTGGGFAPGETITLLFERNPETSEATTLTAVADGNGAFVNAEYICRQSDANVTFTLTATGQSSGSIAVTSFTDSGYYYASQAATPTYGDGTATVTVNVTREVYNNGIGATTCTNGDTYTFTLSNFSNTTVSGNSTVSMVMSGCPPAPNASAYGYGSVKVNINVGSPTPRFSTFDISYTGPNGSASWTQTITMNQATATVAIDGLTTTVYNGLVQPKTTTVYGVSSANLGAGTDVQYEGFSQGASYPKDAGFYTITADYAGSTNYASFNNKAATNNDYEIQKANYTSVNIISANPVTYNCAAQPATLRVTGVNGETFTSGITGYYDGVVESGTNPRNAKPAGYVVTADWTGTPNYNSFTNQPVGGSPYVINKATPAVASSYASGNGSYIYDGTSKPITGTATGCNPDNSLTDGEGSIAYWYQGSLADGPVNGYVLTNTPPTDAGYYTAYTAYTDASGNYNNNNSSSLPIHINKATPQAILTPNLTIFDYFENMVDREVEDDPTDPLQGEGGLVQVTGINNTVIQNPVAVGDTYHAAATDQGCPHTAPGAGPPPDINTGWSNTGYDEAGYYVVGADYAGTNNYLPLDNVNSCVTSACTPPGNNYVYEITVDSEGAGYTPGTYAVPIVPVVGGAGATASAVVDAYGKVKFATITAAGSGYSTGATVNLSGIPGGVGAGATVRIATPQGLGSAVVVVTNGGTGYANSFAVSFTGGGCTVAPTGTATAVGGVVQSVAIDTNGSGCTSAPVVNFSAGGGFGALASVRFPASPKAGVFRINGTPHEIIGPFVDNAPYDGVTKLGVQDITLVARHVYSAPHANAGQPTMKQLSWETYNNDNSAENPSWYCSVSNVQGPDANGDTTVTLRIDHATPDPSSVCRVRAFYEDDCDFNGSTQWTQDVFINPAQLLASWAPPMAISTTTPLAQIPVPVLPSVSNAVHQLNAAVYWINDQNGTATPTLAGVYADSLYCDSVFPFVLTTCPAPAYAEGYTYYPPAGTTLPQGTQTLSLSFTTRSAGGVNNPDFITPVAHNQYITVNAPATPPPPPVSYCDLYHSATVPSRSITVTTTTGLDTITSLGLFKDTDAGSFVSGTGMPAYAAIVAVVDDSNAIISGAATMAGDRPITISTTVPALKVLPTRSFTAMTTGAGMTVKSVAAPYGFISTDVGRTISGTGIPAGATITGVTTGTVCGTAGPATCSEATISAAATRTGSAMMTVNGTSEGPMRGMVAGDFNSDGFRDLVVANNTSLAYYQGRGDTLLPDGADGTFYPPVQIANGFTSLYEMVTADFTGDGFPDFAVTDTRNGAAGVVLVYSTDGAAVPTWTLEATVPVGGDPYSLAVGHMDDTGTLGDYSDDDLDLVVTDALNYNVQIWLGDGAGGFGAPPAAPACPDPACLNTQTYTLNAGNKPWGVVIGNFLGGADGINDVMVALNGTTNSVAILKGDNAGRFVSLSKIIKNVNGPYPRTLAAADLDLDGDMDVLVGNYGNTATTPTGSVYKMLQAGDGTGNFTTSSAAAVVRPSSIVIGDIMDDAGVPDFAVVSATANAVFMFRGTGGGAFTAFKNNTTGVKATGTAPYTVVIGDFDDVGGDLRPEIVTNGSTELKVFAANQSPTAAITKVVSARSFSATTTLGTTITSSGFFRALDATLNATIASTGIPAGTTITGYGTNSSVTMSAAATLAGPRTVTVTETDTVAPFNVFTGGKSATMTVSFTGTGPYTLKWSDGLTQTTATSTISRSVTTTVNKTYTILSVTGVSSCGGSVAGATSSATLTVTP